MRPLYEEMLGGFIISGQQLTHANREINLVKG